MKKILIWMLAMAMMLPLLGLAEEPAAAPPASAVEEVAAPQARTALKALGRRVRSWMQGLSQPDFVDADGDGLCDLCGAGQGEDGQAFLDKSKEGNCDHRWVGADGTVIPAGRMPLPRRLLRGLQLSEGSEEAEAEGVNCPCCGAGMRGRGRQMQGPGGKQGQGRGVRPMGPGRNRR